jgi:hypothetical protein
VHDLAGLRYVIDRDQLEPFDVSNDGDAHSVRIAPQGAHVAARAGPPWPGQQSRGR